MLDNSFQLSDICIEVIETADRYIKAVLINTKKRYFKVLRRFAQNGITFLELEKIETSYACPDDGFVLVDSECFAVGDEMVILEKSDLTDALHNLTPMQLDVLLRLTFQNGTQEELAAEYGVSKRMIQKHKHNAIIKLRKRLER